MSGTKRTSLPPKITRPRARRVLARTRLFRLVDRAGDVPLLWVTAPPGAGKTTLISHYLEQKRRPHLWYHVDPGDRDVSGLFNWLALAVEKARSRKRLPRLTPEYRGDLEGFCRLFFRALFQHLDAPTMLVFDDYQVLAEGEAFHHALCVALEEMPPGHQIVVLSHAVAPPAFAGPGPRQMASIDWEALRLTVDETRRLARVRRDAGATPEHLHAQCEGWVTGFMLLLEESRGSRKRPMKADAGLSTAVAEYFEEHVFARASQELQQLWLRTAFLPSFSAAVATEVSGMRNAAALIRTLARGQFFVEHGDSVAAVYRYHALWLQFLQHKARATYASGELQRLLWRSAAALGAQGDYEAAFELSCAAMDWESAIERALAAAPALLAQGRARTLGDWIGRLPRTMVDANPWLLYWAAVCLTLTEPQAGTAAIGLAHAAFEQLQDKTGQVMCASLAVAANIAEWGNFPERARWKLELEQLLLERVRFPDPVAESRAWSSLLLVYSFEVGEFAFAETCAERVLTLCREPLPDAERLTAAAHLLFFRCQVGSAEQAQEVRREFAFLADTPAASPVQKAHWLWMEATATYHSGDHAGTARLNQRALGFVVGTGPHAMQMTLKLLLVWTQLAQMEKARAHTELDIQASQLDRARPNDVALYHHLRAWLQLLEGNAPAAVEHAAIATGITRELATRSSLVCSGCVHALALAACGRVEEAMSVSAESLRASEGARGIVLFSAQIVRAELLRRQPGQQQAFHQALREAFATARNSGFVQSLIWIPERMSQLCAEAIRAGIEPEHVALMIRLRQLPPPEADTENWPWRVRIYTLGRFEIVIDGQRLRFQGKVQRRPLDLLKLLVALGGRKIPAERLIGQMWPEAEGDAAHHAFKVALHRLRRLLGGDEAVCLENGEVTLDAGQMLVDIWSFERWFGQANGPASGAALADGTVATMLGLYQGAFLGGDTQPWALIARERLRSKYLRGVALAGDVLQRRDAWRQAVGLYERAIDVEPGAEEIYARLIRSYQQLGQPGEALTVYRRCETVMVSLLGIPPGRKLRALYEELRQVV